MSQDNFIPADKLAEERSYWLKKFSGEIAPGKLSADFPSGKEYKSAHCNVKLDTETAGHFMRISKNKDLSLFVIFLTIFKITLSKYSQQEELIVSAPPYGSGARDYNRNVAFRNFIKADMAFKEVLMTVKNSVSAGYGHQYLPFEMLVDSLDLIDGAALTRYILLLESIHDILLARETGQRFGNDIIFSVDKTGNELMVSISYNERLFKEETMMRFFGSFNHIACQVFTDTSVLIKDIEAITPEWKQKILEDFNNSRSDYPADKSIHCLFEEQVERTPCNSAIIGAAGVGTEDNCLTYRQLNDTADRVAVMLRKRGMPPQSIIGLIMDDSAITAAVILGVLKAGCIYLPIDPQYPMERIAYIVDDSQLSLLMVDACFGDRFNVNDDHVIVLPISVDSLPDEQHHTANTLTSPGEIAYVIYTSGTTGRPKGVLVKHRGIVNFTCWRIAFHGFKETDVTLQLFSYCFDGFCANFYAPLLSGGTLLMIAADYKLDYQYINDLVVKHAVTNTTMVPDMYEALLEVSQCSDLIGLRFVVLAGEKAGAELLERALKKAPKVIHINEYGPTEASVGSTVNTGITKANTAVVGKPIANTCIYILDNNFKVLPPSVPGEIYIGGDGVARGYLNRPTLTAEKFIDNPFSASSTLLYRTGDSGRWMDDGSIELSGRIDHQIKIRGFRIETGEIENRLLQHDNISDAVVTAIVSPQSNTKTDSNEKYLCAYCVASIPIESRQLEAFLSSQLPDYMVPTYFIQLDKIPLTPNGKIDRKSLPMPETHTGFCAPRDEVDKKLAAIWSEVLGVEKESIGIDHNFFKLGGHSLKATVQAARIHKELNVKVPLDEIFKMPTIRGLSGFIKEAVKEEFFAIETAETRTYYPLAPAQMRLYFLQQMDLDGTAYNLPQAVRLTGESNPVKMEGTVKNLIQRHDALRTAFIVINEKPVQIIDSAENVDFQIQYIDASKKSSDQIKQYVNRFIQSFDLSQSPLLRMELIREAPGEHILLMDMHHIITDGISMSLFIGEFISLLAGEELPPLKLQYTDYVLWLQGKEQQTAVCEQEKYWLAQFSGDIPILELPTDFPRPAVQSFEGNRFHFQLSQQQTSQLNRLADETGTTLYMVLLALFNILLSKLSRQDDIIVGTPIAARRHVDLQKIIGMFVNTLALRNFPCRTIGFREFLLEVKKRTLDAFENQEYQFEDLVEQILVNRDAGRNPLFDVVLSLPNIEEQYESLPTGELGGLIFSPYERENLTSKFDLNLGPTEVDGRLDFTFEYCTRLFKKETVQRFASYFKTIATAVISDPDIVLGKMEVVTGEEKKRLLFDFNSGDPSYPEQKKIHEIFQDQAEKKPQKAALVMGGQETSYNRLNQETDHLAELLRDYGVKPDTIVALLMDRSTDMITAIIGILKAGGAYMPIDPQYPEQRKNYMLKDSCTSLLITNSHNTGELEFDGQILVWEDLPKETLIGCGNRGGKTSSPVTSSNHLAYVIYTSGTTGSPKGSLIEHRNVVQLMKPRSSLFDFNDTDVWSMFHSFCFDFSVWEMYGALLFGGRLVVVPAEATKDTQQFLGILQREKITVLNQTPAAFYNLAELEVKRVGEPLNVRYVIFGGDALQPAKLKEWKKKYPNTRLINMFGITETTVHVTFKELDATDIASGINNIGRPIPTLTIYLMDGHLRLIPIGSTGELCVGGAGVCRGYLNRPQLTHEKFITNPYNEGEVLYRSGDQGRFTSTGDIEYRGRIDHQVKVRGYRIELGEIESCLVKHPGIKSAVVLPRWYGGGTQPLTPSDAFLCAYFLPEKLSIPTEPSILKDHLALSLPDYMIPSHFIQLEAIPLTPNGKLDRKALPLPQVSQKNHGAAPRDPIEIAVAQIWSEVLYIEFDKISIDDNFFELGGHSLKATSLTTKIHKTLNVRMPLTEIFLAPTIREQGRYIKGAVKELYESIDPVEKRDYYFLSSAQKRLYVLHQLEPQGIHYNLPSAIFLTFSPDIKKIKEVFDLLILRHESLRTVFREVGDTPVQRVFDTDNLPPFDLKHKRVNHWEKDAIINIIENFVRPFDLSLPPLLRAMLIEISNSMPLLLVDIHHIISDEVSQGILEREFLEIYEGGSLPQLPLHYKDFSQWQNSCMETAYIRQQETFWLNELSGDIPVLDIPLDFPRTGDPAFKGSSVYFTLNPQLTGKIREFISRTGMTQLMFLIAAYKILLAKFTGQEEIIVGTVIAGRRHSDLDNIIGFFVNMLAIRSRIIPDTSFASFTAQIKEKALTAYENQDYPFEELVGKLQLKRQPGRHPLIDTVFVMQELDEPSRPQSSVDTQIREHLMDAAHFDLMLHATSKADVINMYFEYSTALFKPVTIEEISSSYQRIIEQVLQNTDILIRDINCGHRFVTLQTNVLKDDGHDFNF